VEPGSHDLDPNDENGTRDVMTWTGMDTLHVVHNRPHGTLYLFQKRLDIQYSTHQRSAIILVFRSDTGSFTGTLCIQLRKSSLVLPLNKECTLSLCPLRHSGLYWIGAFKVTLELLDSEAALLGKLVRHAGCNQVLSELGEGMTPGRR
jgi:hypothetical protein